MKCIDLRRHVARQEDPQRLPAEARGHLNSCSPCRAWYRKLLQVERQVPALVTPPSRRKTAFVNKVLSGAVPVARPTTPQPWWNGTGKAAVQPNRNRGQRKLAFVTALAAGLLIFAVSFTAVQLPTGGDGGIPKLPSAHEQRIAELMKPVQNLPEDASPRERMETLAAVADQTHGVSRALTAGGGTSDDLNALARWYRTVLHPKMVEQAAYLPHDQRQNVLSSIASQLDTISLDTETVAQGLTGRSAQALRDLAAATRDTSKVLRDRSI